MNRRRVFSVVAKSLVNLVAFGVIFGLIVDAMAVNSDARSLELNNLLNTIDNASTLGQAQARISLDQRGLATYVGAPESGYFRVDKMVAGRPDKTAREFLRQHAKLLGIDSSNIDLIVQSVQQSRSRSFVRFNQRYFDIPVFASEIIVQLNAQDGVEAVFSDIAYPLSADQIRFSLTPTISEDAARNRVSDFFRERHPTITIEINQPKLVLFAPQVLSVVGETKLVWEMKVTSQTDVTVNGHILLDAHDANIVRHYPLHKHVLNRIVFDANNTGADPGTLRRSEGQGVSNIADVDDAYEFLGDAYDFFQSQHARDSVNGGGSELSATVRYCESGEPCPYANAFWDGTRFYFGDGWATDDVVAHEYVHGVTQFESNLVYENHAGAINESFSDVWGEFIDLGNAAGTDTAAVRWQIGEDLAGGAIRNMRNPGLFSDPDRLSSPNFVAPVSNPNDNNDWGGVHTNSGVNNKLAYLLTDGDTFNGQTVNAMGVTRIADLYYEVNANILTSGADYFALYNALTQAAVNLGWSVSERNNLFRASLAVEIANNQKDIYIDSAHTGLEFGTQFFPYNTVTEGHDNARPGDRLLIKSGSYNESIVIDKRVDIISTDGLVVIGE